MFDHVHGAVHGMCNCRIVFSTRVVFEMLQVPRYCHDLSVYLLLPCLGDLVCACLSLLLLNVQDQVIELN